MLHDIQLQPLHVLKESWHIGILLRWAIRRIVVCIDENLFFGKIDHQHVLIVDGSLHRINLHDLYTVAYRIFLVDGLQRKVSGHA